MGEMRVESTSTVRTLNLFTPDGAREALAALTTRFLAEGESADVNRFKAAVAAIGLILEDHSRRSRDELETNLEQLKHRLDEWEQAGGNA